MSTIKDMVAMRFDLEKQLAEHEAALRREIISLHATNKPGDVMKHNYRGGGKFVVDDVKVRVSYYDAGTLHWCNGQNAIINIEYHGRAIKKDGTVGTMHVQVGQHVGHVVLVQKGGAE